VRLLYVSHSFPPLGRPLESVGGMQRVATELETALAANPDVALTSIVLRSAWRWIYARMVAFLPRTGWEIARRAARGEIDVVLFSSIVTATLAAPLRKTLARHGVKAAAIAHGQDVTLPVSPYQRALPRVFGALDALLPVSRATGAACLARGLAREKLHVVPNGIDLGRFGPLENRRRMRDALVAALDVPGQALPDDALLLCSVGRQVQRKGFAWFIDTVMPLLPPTVHYWLAGEGPEAAHIEAAIARHGLQARVRLLGRIPDDTLETLYRGADLFVMPNVHVPGDMEGFGVVMLEAGLCGLPTVAARLEGILDVIEDGANGHLVESEDARAFARAILRYEQDRSLLEPAAARARDYVAAHFSWTAVARQHVAVLASLLA
jgi:phosphatidylinositol alpha-1,6-mannosyltransferase